MSWAALKWSETVELSNVPGDPSTNRLLLLLLARRAGDCGHAWPKQDFLVETMGKKDRTVRLTVEYLVEAGLIAAYHRNRFGEKHRSTMYLVLFPERMVTEDCPGCEIDYTRQSIAESTRHPIAASTRQPVAGEQAVSEPSEEESERQEQPVRALVHVKSAPDPNLPEWSIKLIERLPAFQTRPLTAGEIGELARDHPAVDWNIEIPKFAAWHRERAERTGKLSPTARGRMRALHTWGSNARTFNTVTTPTEEVIPRSRHDLFDPNCPCEGCVADRKDGTSIMQHFTA